jgi:hypothetical protein
MKKRLEAELISIAHRVLKLKNKSEVDQLYLESKKLYETLTILKFYGDNFDQVKATLSEKDLEEKLAISLDEEVVEVKSEPIVEVSEPIIEEKTLEVEEEKVEVKEEVISEVEEAIIEIPEKEIVEEITPEVIADAEIAEVVAKEEIAPEAIEQKVEETPKSDFELTFDSKLNDDEKPKAKTSEIIFDDFLGSNYADPVFVKPEDLAIEKEIEKKEKEKTEAKSVASIDKNTKGITIGLNDRVAFMKHLFGNSSEDYNRVLSQLITFDTYQEAQTFIADMVKPDYNDWKGKEDYEVRFMEIVEKKFS